MNVISRGEAKQLGLKRYFTGKPCKHGHIAERVTVNGTCIDCESISQSKKYKNNKDKYSIKHKEYYQRNKHLISERNKTRREERSITYKNWYNTNKKLRSIYRKAWYENNKQHVLNYNRKRNYDNPLLAFTRSSLQRMENAKTINRINRVETELGYTQDEFIKHIESQFVDGMSWSNRSKWHIDHKIPVSAWLSVGVNDIKVINSLENLQPLWAKDNLSKGSKIHE